MKKIFLVIIKILRDIIYIIFAIFIIVFILLLIWQNINFKPLKINDIDSVEKIKVSLDIIEEDVMSSYESVIMEEDSIRDFNNRTRNVKAKKIINGGGIDTNINIYIEVYYTGERLECYTIYGNQILLNEGKEAYQMNESESEKLQGYFLQLCK